MYYKRECENLSKSKEVKTIERIKEKIKKN
jgi:hypothetical protein